MRLFQFPTAAAVAAGALVALTLAVPAAAQEASDCDMLCRIRGYLSSDHMAASPPEAGPAHAPAKVRHPRAAGRVLPSEAKPAAKPVAAATASPHPPATRGDAAPRVVTAATKAETPVRVKGGPGAPSASRAAAADPTAPVPPVRVAAAAEIGRPAPGTPALAKAPRPPVAPERGVAKRPPAARSTPAATGVAAAEVPAARPTRTASLSTAIPGSAPAMQAGFH